MLVIKIQVSHVGSTFRYQRLVITIQVLHVGNNISMYLMLVITIQISYVGDKHPGISSWQ